MTHSPTDEELRDHCAMMVEFMKNGALIPFFGAGVNRSNRPPGTPFTIGGPYLPDANELSRNLAAKFRYPWIDPKDPKTDPDLLRVAWYASYKWGEGRLYEYLHGIFGREDYPVTDVHQFFAELPKRLKAKGYPNPNQIIITTNYDELLERAFNAKEEPYDLLSYVPLSETGDPMEVGKFRYTPHGGERDMIFDPTTYKKMKFDLPMIVKIHGAVDKSWERSSFVITEDDYIDYLARMNTTSHIPSTMLVRMQPKSFLFLGYSLSDWNLRVFLHSIRASQRFKNRSWAVMKDPKPWDEDYWQKHNVELLQIPLKEYIAALSDQLDALTANKGSSSV